MPITDKGLEYDIPPEYKAMITKAFLQTLKYEVKVVFAKDDSDPRWYEEETWIYLAGTGGWNIAFHKATKLHKLDALADYYDTLEWYDSDMFDSDIIDLALLHNVIAPMPLVTPWEMFKGHIKYGWWFFEVDLKRFLSWFKKK